jgi:hypothetical protein
MAKGKKLVDTVMSGVKTPAQMKAEMAVGRARNVEPAPAVEQTSEFRPTQAGDTVGGYVVREDIPDRSSIGASLENYKTLGLQEVPMTAFGVQGKPQYYSKQTREYTQNLANQISQNKELNPLIVVKDKEGYYVLEGGHRFDALRELDAQSFPALVVEDLDGMARGGIIKMGKGGLGRKLGDKILPKVETSRIDMSFKDVTKRTPELQEAAQRVASGEMSAAEYDALVNQVKPVTPYDFVPTPATREEAVGALTANKKEKYGAAEEWEAGTPVGLRLDIPAYSDHGVWVNSIHGPDSTAYGNVSSVTDAKFGNFDDKALKVAQGAAKSPFAKIEGKWNPIEEQEAVKRASEYLQNPEWRQVGMDPERHGYFYDRKTMEPIVASEEVIQIGPLVLAKNPVYGDKGDFKFAHGGIVNMSKGGAGRKIADKLLPKVEAPSVMTRSEISDLADYIKNREGGYGLRRVERAADEIPRLGEMYTQDALRSAFSGDNARALMTMNPADFERYATPLDKKLRDENAANIERLIGIRANSGFSDVPYFMINKENLGTSEIPYIAGHEGRHRNRAFEATGDKTGLVVLNPRAGLREPFPRRSQQEYIEALKNEFSITGNRIKPQNDFDESLERIVRSPIVLPDMYAKGGAVKMAEGGEADQAEIDRMRLELSNSPVIQATPRSPLQRGIGTLGGYMSQAGDFINKAVEPIAESNPVKTFIAELFGDSFKSAGTALQDYTKTSRDITEDQPYRRAPITGKGQTMSLDPRMLDVIGFADPVARLGIKGVRAGAKAAAPFAKDVGEMASELYMRGDIPGMPSPNMYAVAPDGKPSKVLAPANEIGFYSPTEAAALNVQRKSGSGQAFLNDIMKGENVKADEISAMGLDTFLKGKTNVTADEVRDYIAQNKIQLGETVYGGQIKEDPVGIANRKEVFDRYEPQIQALYNEFDGLKIRLPNGELNPRYNEIQNLLNDLQLKRDAEADAVYTIPENKESKFSSYALPGGENYREIVLTLPTKIDTSGYKITGSGNSWYLRDADNNILEAFGSKDQAEKTMETRASLKQPDIYKSSHWDEPNPLAHLRVSDRVTDGKKTLLVDEVQSDWHQAGRERGYVSPDDKTSAQLEKELTAVTTKRSQLLEEAANLPDSEMEKFISMNEEIKRLSEQAKQLDQQWTDSFNNPKKVPDAPYKDDWYQLTLRRAIKEAIDGGYDRVALPTGARVADRFDLSKQVDRLDYSKESDGTYSLSGIKDGQEVVNKQGLSEKELADNVGKEVAEKMIKGEGKEPTPEEIEIAEDLGFGAFKSLSGLDLSVGGKGMRKYYDEIYPSYLKKFGKKYGAEVGDTKLPLPIPRMDKPTGWGGAQYMKGEITLEEYLKMNPDVAKKYTETLHYMDITPAMRKEFSTGIHMKSGGKVQFAKSLDAMRHELTKAK